MLLRALTTSWQVPSSTTSGQRRKDYREDRLSPLSPLSSLEPIRVPPLSQAPERGWGVCLRVSPPADGPLSLAEPARPMTTWAERPPACACCMCRSLPGPAALAAHLVALGGLATVPAPTGRPLALSR